MTSPDPEQESEEERSRREARALEDAFGEACMGPRTWTRGLSIAFVANAAFGLTALAVVGAPLRLALAGAGVCVAVLLAQLVTRLVTPGERAHAARERAWLAGLPFRVTRYERFLVSAGKHWRLHLSFEGQAPPDDDLVARFAHVSHGVSVGGHREETGRVDVRLEVPSLSGASEGRGHRARLLFHRVVDDVLRPLHAERPIAALEIE